ncbi:MAG TPA: Rpn family recombination-promoting nuclease/putative transposase [Thermoanaerobaculia bacterium]|jgi:hypothetical protein|nr:Rpn family recombination-promoting nuclease/putative transposase [Thermoanaerobaculia bacterium]
MSTVLLEFQSRPDRYMPVRLMTYIGLFYESLIAEGKLPPSGLLPQVIPIVIYNGLGAWNGPRDLAELIQCVAEQYVPHLPFKLVHEAAYRAEELEASESPVADLFRLEKSRSWTDVLTGVSSVRRHVGPDERELRRAFETWLIEVIAPRLGLASNLLTALTLEEFESMLAERIDMWNRELEEQSLQKGLQQGLQRGQQEGQEQGQRQALLLLLEKRFGFVDQGTRDRIAAAKADRLLDWFARFATAEKVTDVFGN